MNQTHLKGIHKTGLYTVTGDEKYNNEQYLKDLFLGHRSLIRNRTQTAVITIFRPFSLLYKYSFQNGIGTLENVC